MTDPAVIEAGAEEVSADLAIRQALAAPLDASRVKRRAAGGNRPALSYLETHDVIRRANDIFGHGGWGHEVIELRQIEAVAVHNAQGTAGICVGYLCVVRVTVGGYEKTSGVGYGDATEYRESAAVTAHELAAKEAESDALKRALKNFGDQFGLALYDKQAASSGHLTNGTGTVAEPGEARSSVSGEGRSTDERQTDLGSRSTHVPGSATASTPQLGKIRGLRDELVAAGAFDRTQFDALVSVDYGVESLDAISKADASTLIKRLEARKAQ